MTSNTPAPSRLVTLFRGFGIFVLFVAGATLFFYLTA